MKIHLHNPLLLNAGRPSVLVPKIRSLGFLRFYSYAQAGVASPDAISGLLAWWRADAEHLWQDAAGTTPVSDGSKVYRWDDRSGNGHDLTGFWPNHEFVYFRASVSALNGQPAVENTAGGSGTFRSATAWAPVTGAEGRTVAAVGYALGSKLVYSYGHIVHWGEMASLQAYGLTCKTAGANLFGNHYWNDSWQAVANDGGAHILMVAYDGSKDHFWLDGSEASTTKTVSLNTVAGQKLALGGRIDTGGSTETGLGYIAEVVIYDHYLTASERGQLLQYFSQRYGIAV